MLCLESAQKLNQQVRDWRRDGQTIAFVPTMGSLHQGHLSLLKKARSVADRVVVSIYINPMQFGVDEDLGGYPSNLAADQKALSDLSLDLLFLPSNNTMYPDGIESASQVMVPGYSDILCGEFRPGHFAGVTTVVNKLFNIVQPDAAIFGEKDFQQVFIIKKMVKDLFMPIKVINSPTLRESDGLAMSSRNQYLTNEQRQQATQVYQILLELKEKASKVDDFRQLESIGTEKLKLAGFQVDYVSFRCTETLRPAERSDSKMVILVAAWLGNTRLIDNVKVASFSPP